MNNIYNNKFRNRSKDSSETKISKANIYSLLVLVWQHSSFQLTNSLIA